MFDFLDVPAEGAFHLVAWLATATGTAAAIVLFTACVRLLLHPLARSAVRGEKARAALAPQAAGIREKHHRNPERMQREMLALYQDSGTSLFAGCLPMLLQLPVFMVMYHLFTAPAINGTANGLLSEVMFGAPLGSRLFGSGGGLVFAVLFVALLVVGYFSSRALPPETPKFMRLLPFGTSLAVVVVPLAAGLYLLTTTTWTVVERAYLRR
ncbi:YidC/Oxa1 family membrane protein insertase [Kibdelosporangium banguiense]|uniref:Membrane protein insertase YidC n=1 Tax=Kibdelosporangium banguiense TaxID=1365924 RepID=A0ABS4TLN9_9PSEU|nr:membrane protein insertase YidC [Kibdelosporangium banguiense]MBP2325244.1 YidC/Oxa1 family membrane protein insertase [Kibdelosporangium banguiense]